MINEIVKLDIEREKISFKKNKYNVYSAARISDNKFYLMCKLGGIEFIPENEMLQVIEVQWFYEKNVRMRRTLGVVVKGRTSTISYIYILNKDGK